MTDFEFWFLRWFVAGSLLLLVGRALFSRLKSPMLRSQWAAGVVRAVVLLPFLCLLPTWWAFPTAQEPAPRQVSEVKTVQTKIDSTLVEESFDVIESQSDNPVTVAESPTREVPDVTWRSVARLLLVGYFLVSGFHLLRLGVGAIQLRRLRTRSIEAPEFVERQVAQLTPRGDTPPEVRLSRAVPSPLCFGFFRPIILLPNAMIANDARKLSWTLGHELDHIRRGDPQSAWWNELARAFYFPLPWYWSLAREWKLTQEYLADVAASQGSPIDYAEFLLDMTRKPLRLQLPAQGVQGTKSELNWRVTMLLESRFPKETFRKRFVPAFVAFAFALGAAGFGFAEPPKEQTEKNPDQAGKPDPKKLVEKNERTTFQQKGEKLERVKVDVVELQKKIDDAVKKGNVQEVQRLMQEMVGAKIGIEMEQMEQMGIVGIDVDPTARMGMRGLFRAGFGVMVSPVDSVVADQLDLPNGKGLTVTRVGHGSVAQKSGVMKHDILISFAGKEVTSDVEKFRKLVESIEPGTEFEVVVKRKGKEETLKGCKIPALKPEGIVQGTATFKEGQFALGSSDGKVSINIKGSMKDGKKEVEMIVITKDGKTETYKSLEEVPEEQREAVKKLIQ